MFWREQDVHGNRVAFTVGQMGVTRIEAIKKPREYSYVPYVRISAGDNPIAEFCHHRLVGLYFEAAKERFAHNCAF